MALGAETGLFAMDPWQSGAKDGLCVARAEMVVDPAGAPWASLQLWLPEGFGHDSYAWIGDRWLRIDLVNNSIEYLVDLDGTLVREDVWAFDPEEITVDDLRSPAGTSDLLYAFSVIADVAPGLRIAPLTASLAANHAGIQSLDSANVQPRWSPGD